MKQIIVALAFGVLMAGSALAQNAPEQHKRNRAEHRMERQNKAKRTPEERAKIKSEKLSQQLGLSKSQTKRLEALHLQQAQEMKALRAQHQKGQKPTAQQRAQVKVARAKWDAEMRSILTKKQYAQYQEQRQEMRAHRRDRTQRRGHAQERKYNG